MHIKKLLNTNKYTYKKLVNTNDDMSRFILNFIICFQSLMM